MQLLFALVVLAAVLCCSFATTYQTPPPTFDSRDFTVWHKRGINKSRRADIKVTFTDEDNNPDYVNLFRLDMVGNSYERGYAHGYLLAKEIVEFNLKMDKFYMDGVLNLDLSKYPEPLQKILEVVKVKGAIAAPDAAKKAMMWVWDKEFDYTPQYIKDEIHGVAVGMCDALGDKCDVAHWEYQLQAFNMMPELIRMACTAYGAWGPATPSGKGLVQVRALDFGSGPFSNYTIVGTHRQTENDHAFTSIVFPGMVGAITGVSQTGVGISEKVWMTYDEHNLQPGSFQGIADVFVLRELLQSSKNKADAERYVQSIPRTWAIWIGLGDYDTMQFDLVGYKQNEANVYTDVTAPSMTGQPYINSVAYVDKHPQPSGEGPNGTLPRVLSDFWGNLTLETSKIVTQYHNTGDVHIASYDFEAKEMYLAVGKIDKDGKYGPNDDIWSACNRPYVKFHLDDLWSGK